MKAVNWIRTKFELLFEWIVNTFILTDFKKLGTIERWELTNQLDFLHVLLKEEYILFYVEDENARYPNTLIYLFDNKLFRCNTKLGEVTREELINKKEPLDSLQEKVVDRLITASGYLYNPKFISDPQEIEIKPWKVELIKRMLIYQSKRGRRTKIVPYSIFHPSNYNHPAFDTKQKDSVITHTLHPKRD